MYLRLSFTVFTVVAVQVFQDALNEAEHFLATGETPRGFEMGLVPEGEDAPEDGAGAGGSGGHPRNKPRDGKGVSKKDGAHLFTLSIFITYRAQGTVLGFCCNLRSKPVLT